MQQSQVAQPQAQDGSVEWLGLFFGPFLGLERELGPPVVPVYPFWGEGSPTKIYRLRQKIGYPYSNLSTGGPRETTCETHLGGFHGCLSLSCGPRVLEETLELGVEVFSCDQFGSIH